MWHEVSNKLIAAMLTLGYTWPLAEALDNHPLVTFINEQHKIQQQAANEEEELQESGSDSTSVVKDGPEEGGEDGKQGLRCTRCDKSLAQVSNTAAK